MSFYEKVARKIHDADPDALFFTEPCYFTNLGAPSGLKKLSLPGQIFAPHGYDLVVDTGRDDLYAPSRIDLIFRRHKETGEKLGLPIFIGEWGAFGSRPGNHQAASQMFRILEENLWSHAYWDWSADIESLPIWRHLVRAYPMATAGTLNAYHWDGEKLSLSYQSVPGITEIFVPGLGQGDWAFQAVEGEIRFEPSIYPDTGHGVLSIISDSRQALQLEIGRK